MTLLTVAAFVAAVWALAFGITIFIYLAVSVAETGDAVRAAVRASAPAMWLVPSYVLLSAGTATGTIAGLLLVANTTRLLISHRAPPERAPNTPPAERRRRERMFRSAHLQQPPFRERCPPLAGAIVMQLGAGAAIAGHPFVAAGLLASGAATWTWASKTRGALRTPDERRGWRSILRILATMLMALAISLVGLSELRHPLEPHLPSARAETQSAMPIFTSPQGVGVDVQGVVLRPGARDPKPHRRVFGGPLLPATSVSSTDPTTIPFSGEYHLFRTSSGRVPSGSTTKTGTPLDSLYATTNGEPMHMEAVQLFSPPIDLSSCEKVQMVIASRDILPGIAVLEFLRRDKVEPAGIALFGMQGDGEETVSFKIPPQSAQFLTSAFRVIFQHNPTHAERNSRIAIRRFILVPAHPRGSEELTSSR